jgi:tight adherence protein C
MDELSNTFGNVFADGSAMMLAVLVFLATAILTFGVMAAVRVRGAVKRRTAGIAVLSGHGHDRAAAEEPASLRQTSLKAAQRILDYTTKHYGSSEQGDAKVLRQRLVRAGIFDPRAVGYFFMGRLMLAVVLAIAAFLVVPMFVSTGGSVFWLIVLLAGGIGYVGPSVYLDKRIKSRTGTYPSLGANIHMTNLEIRAGRTMTDALEHFGDRLGLEEARSFATLIQQSAELGSSITDALRVYSDDMRHKRLSRAEEKAYSLPAKLSVPMMVCIFPVLFVVILLPVIVRLYTHHY